MEDRSVSATASLAALLWVISGCLVLSFCAWGVRGTGLVGVMFAAGGATLTIRSYLIHFADELASRERNAFHLGQDASRFGRLN